MRVDDELPSWMEAVPGSDVPRAQGFEPRAIGWSDVLVPAGRHTFRFRARPLTTGTLDVNLRAEGELVDAAGLRGFWTFGNARVTVTGSPGTPRR